MLKVKNLKVEYGGIKALKGISFEVPKGKIISLIGANGAGKSTTLRTIMGIEKSVSGSIFYENRDISKEKTKDIVASGIVLVPEGRRIFPNLSVEENLILGAYLRSDKKEIKKDMEKVYRLFPRMKERLWQSAGTLSGGEQQMLAVSRALMSKPKILMMDEPSLGLAPLIVKDIFDTIKTLHKGGMTILLIEQNAKAALEIADFAYVLETGKISISGKGKDLLKDKKVIHAYLGEAEKINNS